MKKRLLILALIWAAGTAAIRAQISTDSWVAGAGLSYPRYASVNIDTLNPAFNLNPKCSVIFLCIDR